MKQIVIIGCGAAGMAAAAAAASQDSHVTILERNEKAGKKIYITGKGRGNLTNMIPMDAYFQHIMSNPRFLYSAFSAFTNEDLVRLMKENGTEVKVERGSRAFPESDHASDITRAFLRLLKDKQVQILYHTRATAVSAEGDGEACHVTGVTAERDGKASFFPADAVILCTGGLSYPSTGSTGDGMRIAADLGLSVTETAPSLVPLVCREEDLHEMQGLSLRNVTLHIALPRKKRFECFGEMMFTHFGITGPIVLTASADPLVSKALQGGSALAGFIDLKPSLDEETLDRRLVREISAAGRKGVKSVIETLVPESMVGVLLRRCRIDPGKRAADLDRHDRHAILLALKHFDVTITGTRGYNEAVVTKGGIAVKEFNPKTMESRKIRGLYAAGETLDIDALTGGFNLQCAFSTGVLAGRSAGQDNRNE